jgi:small subunit ribosomal protein S6
MRRYESIFIVDPELNEEQRDVLFNRVRELIPQQDGYLVEFDEWGNQKMAYEVRRKRRGHYVRLDYCGMGPLVNELERFFRIDDRVMKYLTVLLDKDADVAAIQQEKADAEAAREKAAAEAEETSEVGSETVEAATETGAPSQTGSETTETATPTATETSREEA